MDYQQRKQMERKRAEDFIASINAMQDPDIMYKVSHPITDLKDMMNQSVAPVSYTHLAFDEEIYLRIGSDETLLPLCVEYGRIMVLALSLIHI